MRQGSEVGTQVAQGYECFLRRFKLTADNCVHCVSMYYFKNKTIHVCPIRLNRVKQVSSGRAQFRKQP